MTWDELSGVSRNVMRDLGNFGPTVNAADKLVKGYTLDADGDGRRTYYSSAGLRQIAKGCIEAAEWLDKRAELPAALREDAEREAAHYASQYAQDGPIEVQVGIDWMDLEELSLWLVELEATVGRCKLALHAKPGNALCLQVEWEIKGRAMRYEYTLSGIEMKRANAAFQGAVMEQIKCKVIDMHMAVAA